jgi:hypothetical protein
MKVTESKQLPWRRDTVVKWILTVICERRKTFEQNCFKSEQSSKMNKEVFFIFCLEQKSHSLILVNK